MFFGVFDTRFKHFAKLDNSIERMEVDSQDQWFRSVTTEIQYQIKTYYNATAVPLNQTEIIFLGGY